MTMQPVSAGDSNYELGTGLRTREPFYLGLGSAGAAGGIVLETPFRSAKQLASMIRSRKIGCLELLDLFLARVEKYNPGLYAIVVTDIERARKRAKVEDTLLK